MLVLHDDCSEILAKSAAFDGFLRNARPNFRHILLADSFLPGMVGQLESESLAIGQSFDSPVNLGETNTMTFKSLAAAVCISLASATTAFAAPVNVNFEFDAVSGTFYGLDDDDGISSASSLDLKNGTLTWTGLDTSGSLPNSFEFSGGILQSIKFDKAFYIWSDGNRVNLYSLRIDSSLIAPEWSGFAEIYDPGFALEPEVSLYGDISYTITPVSTVPLPAGGFLLISGLGGVAALKRRKKRAA